MSRPLTHLAMLMRATLEEASLGGSDIDDVVVALPRPLFERVKALAAEEWTALMVTEARLAGTGSEFQLEGIRFAVARP